MKVLLIFFSIAYIIQSVLGRCSENSFNKLEHKIPSFKILRYETNILYGNGGDFVITVRDAETLYYARTVDLNLQYKELYVGPNQLCNDLDRGIYTSLDNLRISSFFEFVLKEPTSSPLYISISLPKEHEHLPNIIKDNEVCLYKILLSNDALLSLECISLFTIDQSKNSTIYVMLNDVPIGYCTNESCSQESNREVNIYYAVIANTQNFYRAHYIPEITTCELFSVKRWECVNFTTISGLIKQSLCKTSPYEVYITFFPLFVGMPAASRQVNYIDNPRIPVNKESFCTQKKLPRVVYLHNIILTPLIEIAYPTSIGRYMYMSYIEQDLEREDICLVHITASRIGNVLSYECLDTTFWDTTPTTAGANIPTPNTNGVVNFYALLAIPGIPRKYEFKHLKSSI